MTPLKVYPVMELFYLWNNGRPPIIKRKKKQGSTDFEETLSQEIEDLKRENQYYYEKIHALTEFYNIVAKLNETIENR